MQFRVFPSHDNHIAEYFAQFGARFAKSAGTFNRARWRGSALAAMWAMILAWQAIKLAWGGAK